MSPSVKHDDVAAVTERPGMSSRVSRRAAGIQPEQSGPRANYRAPIGRIGHALHALHVHPPRLPACGVDNDHPPRSEPSQTEPSGLLNVAVTSSVVRPVRRAALPAIVTNPCGAR